MALAQVAIIGRPNVGKSSLLNALAGHMISIVEPTAGVTRDRISTIIEREGRYFELIDTGGYGIVDADHLDAHVEGQIQKAIESAQLVLFMVDIRDGVTPLDKKIAQLLRKQPLDVIGVANKADTGAMFPQAGEFARLGFGEFICVSAKNNLNKTVLLDKVFEEIAHIKSERPVDPVMKIAIVGKRNAGKSTLVNAMAGADRVIVSETPGTTRDAVDVRIERDDKVIVVIDTAGVRKKAKMTDNNIEFYSYVRATRSIRRADVVVFLIDATEPVSQVDKRLARFITDEYKSCIVVINKWDLAKDTSFTDDYDEYLAKELSGLRHAPLVFTTAKTGKNIQTVLDLAGELFKQSRTSVATPRLNKAVEAIQKERSGAKRRHTGWPKVYYATQVAVNPVTILLFVNDPRLFDDNYRRFMVGRLQQMLELPEVPIRLFARSRRTNRPEG